MKKHRTSLALDQEVIEEAQRVADREGVDRADILRRWVRKGKEQEESK
jgi:metal-responsive CopG/Arc/MetJ family transcriptional regulator